MSTFTLAISCLTTSDLPWFMDLTFQVLCNIALYSIRSCFCHQSHPHGYCFCFGSIPSFFLELFLQWSPVAYWVPTDMGSYSFSILSFCLFMLFMWFSRQEYWSDLPFPSPVDRIVSDLSTMPAHLGWPLWHGLLFHWVTQVYDPIISLVSFLWLWFPNCLPSDGEG